MPRNTNQISQSVQSWTDKIKKKFSNIKRTTSLQDNQLASKLPPKESMDLSVAEIDARTPVRNNSAHWGAVSGDYQAPNVNFTAYSPPLPDLSPISHSVSTGTNHLNSGNSFEFSRLNMSGTENILDDNKLAQITQLEKEYENLILEKIELQKDLSTFEKRLDKTKQSSPESQKLKQKISTLQIKTKGMDHSAIALRSFIDSTREQYKREQELSNVTPDTSSDITNLSHILSSIEHERRDLTTLLHLKEREIQQEQARIDNDIKSNSQKLHDLTKQINEKAGNINSVLFKRQQEEIKSITNSNLELQQKKFEMDQNASQLTEISANIAKQSILSDAIQSAIQISGIQPNKEAISDYLEIVRNNITTFQEANPEYQEEVVLKPLAQAINFTYGAEQDELLSTAKTFAANDDEQRKLLDDEIQQVVIEQYRKMGK